MPIDVSRAIKQRTEKGMSLQEIADSHQVSKQAVSQLLHRVTDKDVIRAYTNKRSDVYSLLEADILATVDMDTIKESSLLQRVTAAGILKTHLNLEQGKATSVIGYDPRSLAAGIAELRGMVQVEGTVIDEQDNG